MKPPAAIAKTGMVRNYRERTTRRLVQRVTCVGPNIKNLTEGDSCRCSLLLSLLDTFHRGVRH
jgi:hypothetical protein